MCISIMIELQMTWPTLLITTNALLLLINLCAPCTTLWLLIILFRYDFGKNSQSNQKRFFNRITMGSCQKNKPDDSQDPGTSSLGTKTSQDTQRRSERHKRNNDDVEASLSAPLSLIIFYHRRAYLLTWYQRRMGPPHSLPLYVTSPAESLSSSSSSGSFVSVAESASLKWQREFVSFTKRQLVSSYEP